MNEALGGGKGSVVGAIQSKQRGVGGVALKQSRQRRTLVQLVNILSKGRRIGLDMEQLTQEGPLEGADVGQISEHRLYFLACKAIGSSQSTLEVRKDGQHFHKALFGVH